MGEGLWLVTGVQASGKSTIAELLARHFDAGVHVRGAQFYRWVTRGWVHVGDPRLEEARRLLELRYRLAARVAEEYCAAGFTTVVQDNIYGADVTRWLENLHARPRHLVVLRPSIETVAAREHGRRLATGKVAYRPNESTIEELDDQLSRTSRVGLWLDTSTLTPDETINEILRRRDEATVDSALEDPIT